MSEIDRWCRFKDQKVSQFFEGYLKSQLVHKGYYQIIINTLAIVFIRQMLRSHDIRFLILSLILLCCQILLIKKTSLFSILANLLNITITFSIFRFVRESESEFQIKLFLTFGLINIKALFLEFNWKKITIHNSIITLICLAIRFIIVNDFDLHRGLFILSIFTLFQLGVVLIVSNNEFYIKQLWLFGQKLKKNNQTIEKILHDLPIGMILFDVGGQVVFQNLLSYKYLPREVDIINKVFTTDARTHEGLLLSDHDKTIFKDAYNQVIDQDCQIQLHFAIQGYQIPFTCHLSKQLFKRKPVVQALFIEKCDQQQMIYQRIHQSNEIINMINLSEQVSKVSVNEKSKYNILKILLPQKSSLNYQQTSSVPTQIKNYIMFLADLFNITYDITFLFKISENLPEQVLIDIVKLHSIITSLFNYIQQEYSKKIGQFEQQSFRQLQIPHDSNTRQQQSIKENQPTFAQCFFTFSMDESHNLEIEFQLHFSNVISEFEQLFNQLKQEDLSNQQFRQNYLMKDDFNSVYLVHIIHQINQLGGNFRFFEQPDQLKINFGFKQLPVNNYQSVILENYQSIGKFDPSTLLYQWNNLDNLSRVRSSTMLITSTQRIQYPVRRFQEPQLNVQTSLSEFKTLHYTQLELISIKPTVLPSSRTTAQTRTQQSEDEQKNLMSPNLSPIVSLKKKQNQDVENFDVDEKISSQMHQIEKVVSKTLEQILQDIMQYRGRRLNVHFKSTKPRQRSYDGSPATNNNNQRQRSQPQNVQQQQIQKISSIDDIAKIKQQQQPIPVLKKEKTANFLGKMRENEPINPIVNIQRHQDQDPSPSFNMPQQLTFNNFQSDAIVEQNISIEKQIPYNDNFTILLIDDASFVVNAISNFKFNVTVKVEFSSKIPDALNKLTEMMAQGKIYHLIILKINMPKVDKPLELTDQIRALEKQNGLPAQFILGTANDVTNKLKEDLLGKGFDELAEKPLTSPQLQALIDKRNAELKL